MFDWTTFPATDELSTRRQVTDRYPATYLTVGTPTLASLPRPLRTPPALRHRIAELGRLSDARMAAQTRNAAELALWRDPDALAAGQWWRVSAARRR